AIVGAPPSAGTLDAGGVLRRLGTRCWVLVRLLVPVLQLAFQTTRTAGAAPTAAAVHPGPAAIPARPAEDRHQQQHHEQERDEAAESKSRAFAARPFDGAGPGLTVA